MAKDCAIIADNISFSFGSASRFSLRREPPVWVAKNLSFAVERGETLGVIGFNGAGKTTLLRLMAGILRPDQGTVTTSGTACLLSLGTGFDPNLTGRDNIITGGLLMGHRLKAIRGKMEQVIEFSELGGAIDKQFRTYSAGMRARLAFSVGVTLTPEILLVDEVLAVGDARFKAKSRAVMMERLQGETTVVFVSHSEGEVESLCDKCIWIDNGEMMAMGPASEVVREYKESQGNKKAAKQPHAG